MDQTIPDHSYTWNIRTSWPRSVLPSATSLNRALDVSRPRSADSASRHVWPEHGGGRSNFSAHHARQTTPTDFVPPRGRSTGIGVVRLAGRHKPSPRNLHRRADVGPQLGSRVYLHPARGHAEIGLLPDPGRRRGPWASMWWRGDLAREGYQWHVEGFGWRAAAKLTGGGRSLQGQAFRHGSGLRAAKKIPILGT